ncbi:uncharacterized protein LOC124693492 isoform X1 [Lolium rigidum]|uniref:uncharacterized protein LOC124693492 isoform X1 n=1 Tax=Lolium rigidum TaxID=89674 RepID=UPI001F5D5B9D|nr:uncharacterized protein LOC124693492 isoform X1 [Lolium rigidum]
MGKHSMKGLSSSNRWSSIAMLEEDERALQCDWVSNLPDDLLLNIIERLDVADAMRTGILSRRWKLIPTMLSKLLIEVGSTDNEQKRTCDVARANATVLGATRSLFKSRIASPYTIHRLCMQFFLGAGSIRIGRALANTIATQKVGVAEFTILTEKEGKRCSINDRFAYGRQFNSLINFCGDTFSGLTRLKLENLKLGGSDFPRIFRLCKRLEFLRLDNCDMGFRSLMEVEHPRLRELEIFRSDFERVDLNWLPELTTLTISFWISLHDPLSCGYVPLLHTVSIRNTALSWHKMLKLSELLGKATVSNLTLGFEKEKIWVKPEDPRDLWLVFNKLRLVNLAAISEECDLTWTMFILQGAPSLEELHIRVCDCLGIWDEEEREKHAYSKERKDASAKWEASGFKHHNLSVLRIFGFQSEDKFVDYTRAVMEAAVNLKDIYLHEKPACKEECEYIRQRGCRYPRSNRHKIWVRSSLNMHMHPLLRLHFRF